MRRIKTDADVPSVEGQSWSPAARRPDPLGGRQRRRTPPAACAGTGSGERSEPRAGVVLPPLLIHLVKMVFMTQYSSIYLKFVRYQRNKSYDQSKSHNKSVLSFSITNWSRLTRSPSCAPRGFFTGCNRSLAKTTGRPTDSLALICPMFS